ncbi:MAG: DUF2937 family protein, partial [Alphaproteobacteria bacterium]|nr:DUF2937 family protein [Alphaproteobacteria bacterium]
MLKWVYLTAGIFCALLMSQFPEYYQQYRQRLGGTMDELNRQVEALDQRATSAGLSRFDYIRHLTSSTDKAAKMEGEHLTDLLTRHFSVSEAIVELDATPNKLILFVALLHLDYETAEATAKDYVPAVPLTITSAIYALVGFV